jgi:cytochrome P450
MSVIDVDLFASSSYLAGVPHEAFATLRRESPVHWVIEGESLQPSSGFGWAPQHGTGYWAVTRYADVVEVSRHPDVFSSWVGATQIPDPPTELDLMTVRQMMLNMDPPEHGTLRRIVQKAFVPRAIEKLHESAQRNAREIVDAIIGDGSADFVPTVAAEMPLLMLAEILGVPREDRHLLFDWSNRLIGFDDPEFGGDPANFGAAFLEMFSYAAQLGAAKRAEPGDDLVSIIVNAEVDGAKLSDVEFNMFWLLLVIAGNETTRNMLSGGLLALIEHPDQRDLLLSDPSLVPGAIEEMLRWYSPVIHFRRTARVDTELGGQKIAAGDKVVVYYPSANRDEDVFPDPDRFDITRTPNEHVAFGSGPHFCLGASLARMELRVMFTELLARLPHMELDGPVERMQSSFINGIKHLPVRWDVPN